MTTNTSDKGLETLGGELKGYGTFFDELWLLLIGFDRGQRSNDY